MRYRSENPCQLGAVHTWQLRPAVRYRSENPCQLGAVHTCQLGAVHTWQLRPARAISFRKPLPTRSRPHMAAPTSPCDIVQKTLANSEPSTHAISFRKPLPTRSRPHMAAPTSPCDIVQKTLANSEPSTHARCGRTVRRRPAPTAGGAHGGELVDIAQPIRGIHQHAVAVLHLRQRKRRIGHAGDVDDAGARGEQRGLAGQSMMEGDMHQAKDVAAVDGVDCFDRDGLGSERRDLEAERLDQSLQSGGADQRRQGGQAFAKTASSFLTSGVEFPVIDGNEADGFGAAFDRRLDQGFGLVPALGQPVVETLHLGQRQDAETGIGGCGLYPRGPKRRRRVSWRQNRCGTRRRRNRATRPGR